MKSFATPSKSFRGIFVFKLLLVISCVALVVSAISGIASVATSAHGTVITHHTPSSRLISVGLAIVFGAFCYGLHRRWLAVWRIGFALLILSYLNFIWGMWVTSRVDPNVPPLVLAIFGVFGGVVVTVYWWIWWYRQKPYFVPNWVRSDQGKE